MKDRPIVNIVKPSASVSVTPKGVIMLALGGYSSPFSAALADKVEQALLQHMSTHGLDVVVVQGATEGQSIRFFGKNA